MAGDVLAAVVLVEALAGAVGADVLFDDDVRGTLVGVDAPAAVVSALDAGDVVVVDACSWLDAKQIDAVKDGMTYGVVMVTYKATVDMIPTLKEEEKAQIMAWLVEAREFAMDAENSNKKHAAFGKYKGRINNYLSKRGYDLVKERKAWYERIKARGGKI